MSIGWQRQSGSLVFKADHANTLLTLSETTLTLDANLTGGMVLPPIFTFTATANTAAVVAAEEDDASIKFNLSSAGSDSNALMALEVAVLTGTHGFRQGALNIWVARDEGEEFIATWDGNPDTGAKITVRNYGNNLDSVTLIGGIEGISISARNRGDNLGYVRSMGVSATNDSGSKVTTMTGLALRMENYGSVVTSIEGINLEMSDENMTLSQTRTGIHIRNTDASAQAAVNNIFKISHTSTNGFTYLFHFNAATGDTFTAGDVAPHADPSSSHMGADGYITVLVNATPYYIPCYNSTE